MPDESNPPEFDPIVPERAAADAEGVVRVAAGLWWRTATWSVATGVRAGARLARAATSPESATALVEETRSALVEGARELLGIGEIEDRVQLFAGRPDEVNGTPAPERFREAAEDLLVRSSDVDYDESLHPAYARILTDLSPDEARILRLLATGGLQPAVDVRTWRPFDIGSVIVAAGLSMIGSRAGCRHQDRVPAYLNNLFRLGLIWFSREPVEQASEYDVIEAQPDVLAALRKAGRAKTVRRSIGLTPFGVDFCQACMPLETSELEAIQTALGAPQDSLSDDHG